MSKIVKVNSREILDSRGNPTIETEVFSELGGFGRCSVPSGASTGSNEAFELRDKDNKRFLGKGVIKAVKNVNEVIAPKIIGIDCSNQKEIDNIMIKLDGTKNKSKLGANAILSVSIACLKAAADELNLDLYKYVGNSYSLPDLMINIINGGMHTNNNLDIQEFMIVPKSDSIENKIRMGSEIFHYLGKILNKDKYIVGVGDEGGFAPNLNSNEEALDLIIMSIKKAGYVPGKDVFIALDIAASRLYDQQTKTYNFDCTKEKLTRDELFSYYEKLIEKYPIISIEDPVEENDFEGFKLLTEKIGRQIELVGDDIFVTSEKLLQKGIDMNAGNAIIIKLNQVGTVTEAFRTINLAKKNNYKTIISHRSGETEDTFISDLSVGLNLNQIKTGCISRSDRVSKYNQLLRISEKLNK